MSLENLDLPRRKSHSNNGSTAHPAAVDCVWSELDIWSAAAPRGLRKSGAANDASKTWKRWRKHLQESVSQGGAARRVAKTLRPLMWCAPPAARQILVALQTALSAEAKSKSGKSEHPPTAASKLTSWLDERRGYSGLADGTGEIAWAYATLGLARVMTDLVEHVAAAEWWAILDDLLATVRDAATLSCAEHPLLAQLLAGELPLTLAARLPELRKCQLLESAGRNVVGQGMEELLDGEGTPHQRYWALQRPLAASWTRVGLLDKSNTGFANFDYGVSVEQYARVIQELRRATRANDSQVLLSTAAPDGAAEFTDFLKHAMRLVGEETRRLKKLAKKKAKSTAERSEQPDTAEEAASETKFVSPGNHSEWSQTAIFRTRDTPRAPTVATMYAGQANRVEIGVGGTVIVAGDWTWELSVEGRILEAVSDWSQACHIGDEAADYLELELNLEAGWKIQRRIVLGRKDRFALLADAISGPEGAQNRLVYRTRLALADGVSATPATETREVRIDAPKPRAWVVPCGLPEWNNDRGAGEFLVDAGALETTVRTLGGALFVPVWFDLDSRKLAHPRTWRRLTVGENRTIVSPETAVGYRMQVAARQWMIYHATRIRGNRTLLGHNLVSEFFVGRFQDGKTTAIVETE